MTEFAIQWHKPSLSLGALLHLPKTYEVLVDGVCRSFKDNIYHNPMNLIFPNRKFEKLGENIHDKAHFQITHAF